MLKVITKKFSPIGIDIADDAVRMMQFAAWEGKLIVHRAAVIPIEPNADGNVCTEDIAESIRNTIEQGDFYGNEAVSCLNNTELKIKNLRIDADEDNGMANEQIKAEVESKFDFETDKDEIRFWKTGSVRQGDALKDEYIIFAVEAETIKNHIEFLENAGLTLTGVDTIPGSVYRNASRSLRRQEDQQLPRVILDIAGRFTTVMIIQGDKIVFVKQISKGAEQILEQIAGQLMLEKKEAQTLASKTLSGISDETSRDYHKVIVDSIKTVSDKLVDEIMLCMRYFSVTYRQPKPEKMILICPDIYQDSLTRIFKDEFAIDVEPNYPLKDFVFDDAEFENLDISRPQWTVVAGLACKGFSFAN